MTVRWYGEEAAARGHQAVMQVIVARTERVIGEGTLLINSPPKTGRIYHRRGVAHQASAPGESPAADTGFLAANVDASYNSEQFAGYATWHAAYAAFLEFGTYKMAPRPWAYRALTTGTEGMANEVWAALASGFPTR